MTESSDISCVTLFSYRTAASRILGRRGVTLALVFSTDCTPLFSFRSTRAWQRRGESQLIPLCGIHRRTDTRLNFDPSTCDLFYLCNVDQRESSFPFHLLSEASAQLYSDSYCRPSSTSFEGLLFFYKGGQTGKLSVHPCRAWHGCAGMPVPLRAESPTGNRMPAARKKAAYVGLLRDRIALHDSLVQPCSLRSAPPTPAPAPAHEACDPGRERTWVPSQ